jgi:hypothetical protein
MTIASADRSAGASRMRRVIPPGQVRRPLGRDLPRAIPAEQHAPGTTSGT